MDRQLIEVETICIMDDEVTIAANLQTDKSTYTNIFCDKGQFVDFLLEENSLIAKRIFDSLKEHKFNEYGEKILMTIDYGRRMKSILHSDFKIIESDNAFDYQTKLTS